MTHWRSEGQYFNLSSLTTDLCINHILQKSYKSDILSFFKNFGKGLLKSFLISKNGVAHLLTYCLRALQSLSTNTDSWTPQRDRVKGNNGTASSKTRKRITSNLDVYIQGKYSLNVKGKERYFWTNKKKKKRKCTARIPTLKKILKIVLKARRKLNEIEKAGDSERSEEQYERWICR